LFPFDAVLVIEAFAAVDADGVGTGDDTNCVFAAVLAAAATPEPVVVVAVDAVAALAIDVSPAETVVTVAVGTVLVEPEAADVSSNKTSEPSETLSPSFTVNSLTTPAALLGISILALSDSTVINDCSACTVSPGLTSNSITSTSLKSPISGTLTSIWLIIFTPYFW
jgi:hypothetical protein